MSDRTWVPTDDLLARLPAPARFMAPLIKVSFMGRKEVPPEIPLPDAVALAAAAQARARGVKRFRPVYELIRSRPEAIDDHVAVVPRTGGGRPSLAVGANLRPVSAIVIDLAELQRLVLAGAPIPD